MWDDESCELIKRLHELGVSDKTINEGIKSSLEDMLNIFKGIKGQDQGSNWDIASAHYQDLVDDFFPFSLPAEAYNELEYEDLDSVYYFGAQDGLMYLDEEPSPCLMTTGTARRLQRAPVKLRETTTVIQSGSQGWRWLKFMSVRLGPLIG